MYRSRIAAACAALGLAGTTLLAAGAPASSVTTDATYSCVLGAGGGTDQVLVSVTLDAPATVTAGETVDLAGEVEMTFGDSTAFATTLTLGRVTRVSSTDFALQLSAGDTRRAVTVPDLTTTEVGTGQKPSVSVPFVLEDVLVPSDATGALTLALPSVADVPNPAGSSPAEVAFTAELAGNGLVPRRPVGCTLPDAADARVASIAIEQAAPSVAAPLPELPAAAPVAPVAAAPAPVADVAAAPITPESVVVPVVAAPGLFTASATIPPSTQGRGVHVPPVVVAAVGVTLALLVVSLAVVVALRLRRDLSQLRRSS